MLVGRATRVQRFLMALPKSYETVARFGATSTTGDRDGEITETGGVPDGDLDAADRRRSASARPPTRRSRVDGERAYKRARRGEEVELPEREVTVYAFDELARDGDRRTFAIRCSAGTYVRSLIADLGDAYCEQLRRTAIGPFDVARRRSRADRRRWTRRSRSCRSARLDGDDARRAAHGVAVPDPAPTDRRRRARCA